MFTRLWAVIAAVCFTLALILHLVGGGAGKYVIDFELAGLILVAVSLACWGIAGPWVRTAA
jgi:hypothetical protein